MVGYSLATLICVAIIVLVYRAAPRWILNPVVRHVGKVSYVAYLVHVLVYDRVHALHLPGAAATLISFAITILIATASWYLLEQPLQRLRGKVHPSPRWPSTSPSSVPQGS